MNDISSYLIELQSGMRSRTTPAFFGDPISLETSPHPKRLTRHQVEFLDAFTSATWKYDPGTGLVDVDGDFDCSHQNLIFNLKNLLKNLQGIKFGNVLGDFNCSYNNLTSLEGAPRSVGGYFYCYGNQLTSLEGAPRSVGGHFYCHNNNLTSLEGAPEAVKGDFYCKGNPVSQKTLESIFRLMKGDMSYVESLKTLWPEINDSDRTLMYADHPSLTPEDVRKYRALETYGNIKTQF